LDGKKNMLPLQPQNAKQFISKMSSGNSSVGRARPCQGRGRGFESRFPLNFKKRNIRFFLLSMGLGGGIGRHEGLKIPWQQCRAGSSPASGTKTG
jgi:hypothetical protein